MGRAMQGQLDAIGLPDWKSPLRYPGGKSRAARRIAEMIPAAEMHLCSPFLGGGSVELVCAARGMTVFGYDIFEPLVDFWKILLRKPEQLAEEVSGYYPLSKEKFYRLQSVQLEQMSQLKRAAIFYVLNRSSYSGATLSGGMSPGHPRFTESSIERIRKFRNDRMTVESADFRESLDRHTEHFLYLDPPYLIKNMLYGKKGDTHRDFPHEELCGILKKRERWILSYNDCPEIRDLYRDYRMMEPDWKYGMSKDKRSREVLIFSGDLVGIDFSTFGSGSD